MARVLSIPIMSENFIHKTGNTFFGTWYLSHSQVYNERTVPIIMARCIAHARNGRISTSGQKSDVTIMFFDPIFLKTRKFRRFKADTGLLNICMDFQVVVVERTD